MLSPWLVGERCRRDGGIVYHAGIGGGTFRLHRSLVQGGAGVAVTLRGDFTAADLGTLGVPGDNQLVSTGDVALSYQGTGPGAPIDAHGTRLNGHLHDGDAVGPVQTTDYRIEGPSLIRF